MGLSLNHVKGGTVSVAEHNERQTVDEKTLPVGRIRWGMLYFDADTLHFKIDQKLVDEHIDELRKQLAAKESVFEWIQVWNAFGVKFFDSNFGRAANCFSNIAVRGSIISANLRSSDSSTLCILSPCIAWSTSESKES